MVLFRFAFTIRMDKGQRAQLGMQGVGALWLPPM